MKYINLGDIEPAVTTMGPGTRVGIWVKGCTIACRGCITQQFIPHVPQRVVYVDDLCTYIEQAQREHVIQGISLSGGEPFEQADALADVARHAKQLNLSVIAWSGYTRAFLESARAPSESQRLLSHLDVLIDGPFIASRASNAPPLRGSTNQRIHLLTDAYTPTDLTQRIVSAKVIDNSVVMTGVHNFAASHALMKLFGIA